MPLTISHPAAVLPLSRRGLNLPALIIGSIVPDIIYFFRLASYREFTHSLPGLFLFCLPAGLVLLGIYHALLREPILSLAPFPASPADASARPQASLQRRLAVIAVSLLAGAATHLLWDSFTHEAGFVVEHLPFLSASVLDLGFDRIPLTRILHHGSSLFGAVVIVLWIRKGLRGGYARILARSAAALALSVVFGILISWSCAGPIETYDQLRSMFVGGIFTSGSVLLSFVLLYSLYWRVAPKRSESGRDLVRKGN